VTRGRGRWFRATHRIIYTILFDIGVKIIAPGIRPAIVDPRLLYGGVTWIKRKKGKV
jgi:hypothetical protein